jgi:sugar fermentation stimulation protein A
MGDELMRAEGRYVRAEFVERPNRFVVRANVEGEIVAAHLADPGRLRELLLPGVELVLKRESGSHRKTAFTVFLVRHGEVWVCINTRVPNRVAEEALTQGLIEPLSGYAHVRREVVRGGSRLDFLLTSDGLSDCWVEVKSVSLVEGRRALFPDAPTTRGARHLRELTEIAAGGERAAALFLIQREDVDAFSPHEERDPDFAQALRTAAAGGVEIYAYRCRVNPEEVRVLEPVSVLL